MCCNSDNFGLCNICLSINSLKSYQNVMDSIVKRIADLPFIDASMIRIIDKSCKKLEVSAYCGLSSEYMNKGDIFLSESEVGRRVFVDGETVVVNLENKEHIQYIDSVTKEKITAIITAPLKTTTYSVGVLRGYSFSKTSFTEDEVKIFTQLASQAAIAIETFRSLSRSKSLVDFSQKVTSAKDLNSILQMTVRFASEILNLKGSAIRLYNTNNHQMELYASSGLSEIFLSTGFHSIEQMPIEQEVMSGKTLYIADVSEDERFKRAEMAKEEGVVSLMCLPLKSMEKTFGTLRVYTAHKYVFSEDEVNYLQTLANQTAIAIHNAFVLERMHRLSIVTSTINKSLNKHEVFKQIVVGVTEAAGAVGSALFVWKQSLSQFALRSFHGNISEELLQLVEEYYRERAEQALYEEQVSLKKIHENGKLYEKCCELGVGSLVKIPIKSKDRNVGVLVCFLSIRQGENLSDSELEFFRILANAAATALENVKLYEALHDKYNALVDDVFAWYDETPRGRIEG